MRAPRVWRRLPAPVREAAHRTVQALARAALPVWVALRRARLRAGGDACTIALAGYPASSTGLGQGARLFAAALDAAGVEVVWLDAARWAGVAADLPAPETGAHGGAAGVLVSHLNPPELEHMLIATRARPLQGRRHVGYWAWELPVAPRAWRRAFAYVDEVWAPSAFTAAALRAVAPDGACIEVVAHPMLARAPARPDRADFGLDENACVTLLAFDLKSTAARKNPFAALYAYMRAVPTPRADSILVCKVSGASAAPDLIERLRAACASRPDIRLMNRTLSQGRMDALVAGADIILSLHRAEGFGLLLAEGMRLGKAVVATGWSGNMDFMTPETSALVRFTLTPVADPQRMYDEATVWAEADVEHAAALLAALIGDRQARHRLGHRARRHAAQVFDQQRWDAQVRSRLKALTERAGSTSREQPPARRPNSPGLVP